MTTEEQRRQPRIDSHNLLTYICFDEDNRELTQGMGRTLNVSEGGILMETHIPIDPQGTVALTISMEDDLMDIRGRVAYCREREDGKFETGIQFLEDDETKLRFLKQYITIFKGDSDQK